jgi:lipopolysaccharide export system permease protein
MIKKVDRYLLRHFFLALAVVMVSMILMIIVINMVEELRDFIDNSVPIEKVLEYYLYFAGWAVKMFFPFFVLLATLFSVSMLARRNELLALKASGISLYRVTAPLFLTAILLSAGHFYYNEYIYPKFNERRLEIKVYDIERKSKEVHARLRRVVRQISPGNYYEIGQFNTLREEGTDFKLYNTDNNRLQRIVTSKRIVYVDSRWLAIDAVERNFLMPPHRQFEEFDTLAIKAIDDTPQDLARRIGNPDDMSLDEITYYIDLMKRIGNPYTRESVTLRLKYSFPVTSAIIVLICVPFAGDPRRSGVAVSIAAGTLIALFYFISFRIMQSAGYNEKVPELVAAWGINAVFLVVGLILMITARK